MAIKDEYGKFKIGYNENTDVWTGTLDGETIATSQKLSELKKRLDKHGQAEKAFTRVKVFWKDHWSGWDEGEVTSVTPEGEAWISGEGKKKARHKMGSYNLKSLYLHIDENMQKRQKWDALEVKVKALQEEQETILKAMKAFIPAKAAP